MPTYTYRCTDPNCGFVFEEMNTIANGDTAYCPCAGPGGGSCGTKAVKIPSQVSRPLGGDTPIHYRNRKENR